MVFFQHTLIKFHFLCSTDSPKANFLVVSSIPSIHLFGTLHREQEVPWLPKMTQNESTTTESCGWRQLEKQSNFYYICFVWQQKQRWVCQDESKHFPKRQFWFCHTADKVYETISQVFQPALPAGIHSTYSWARQEGSGRTERRVTEILPHKKQSWAKHHLSKQPIWWFRSQPLFVTTSLSPWNKLKDECSRPVVT